MTQQLEQHNLHYLQEQFTNLYNAIDNISSDRQYGERQQFKINQLLQKEKAWNNDCAEKDSTIAKLMAERDNFRDETKELLTAKKKLENELATAIASHKEKYNRVELRIKNVVELHETL